MTKHNKIAWPVIVVVLLLAGSYLTYALLQPLTMVSAISTLSAPRPTDAKPLTWPSFGQSAVGAVGYGVLDTHGEQTPLATASIAKVITALVVLKHRPLLKGEQGPVITINQDDVDSFNWYYTHDGSVVNVALGEKITEYQALEALLLPSANNIAETLARWAFGSLDAYNSFANRYVAQLGLTHTIVTDPSGFDSSTKSTAEDLTLLAQVVMQNPVLAEVAAKPNAVIPVQGTIRNVNFLLGQDGVIGIKTGNNDGDPGAFLFASKQSVGSHDIMIVGAVMGGPDLITALRASIPLIRSAAANFNATTVIAAGQTVGRYELPDGSHASAVAVKDLTIPVWNGSVIKVSANLRTLHIPTTEQVKVGTVSATPASGIGPTYQAPVHLKSAIKHQGLIWRLSHPF